MSLIATQLAPVHSIIPNPIGFHWFPLDSIGQSSFSHQKIPSGYPRKLPAFSGWGMENAPFWKISFSVEGASEGQFHTAGWLKKCWFHGRSENIRKSNGWFGGSPMLATISESDKAIWWKARGSCWILLMHWCIWTQWYIVCHHRGELWTAYEWISTGELWRSMKIAGSTRSFQNDPTSSAIP